MTALKQAILLVLMTAFSQSLYPQVKLSGTVKTVSGKTLPFASVLLLHDSDLVAATVTDAKGFFSLEKIATVNKNNCLVISLAGYQKFTLCFIDADSLLHDFILQEDKKLLSAVTVTSQKPLITRKADRYIINVENSILANGNSGLEVLQRSPGIWVNSKGNIRIKGNQPVTVMINDIVLRMSEEELAAYLQSFKSEDISRIEVISNPPSEFEAGGQGGIIHIILKKPMKAGLNGSANIQYTQQANKPLFRTGNSLNYKSNRLYLSASSTFSRDLRFIKETADISYPDKSYYTNTTARNEAISYLQYRLSAAIDLPHDHSMLVQVVRNINRMDQSFLSDIMYAGNAQSYTGIAVTQKTRKPQYGSYTFNYTWKPDSLGTLLKLIADYSNSNKKEKIGFEETYNAPLRNTTYRNDLPFSTAVYTLQSDFTKMLKRKTILKAGIKYASIKRDNTYLREDLFAGNWVLNTGISNRFIYTEKIWMGYTSFEKTVKSISIKAGLRFEDTRADANSLTLSRQFRKHYSGLFPSAFLVKTISEAKGNSIFLNYSRRLQRPALNELNPFRLSYNNYTTITGKSSLLPEYSNNLEAGIQFLKNYSLSFYFTGTRNVIGMLADTGVANNIDYRWENIDHSTEYGFNLSAAVNFTKAWNSLNSVSGYRLSYPGSLDQPGQFTFSFKSIHSIKLSESLIISPTMNFRSAQTFANIHSPASFYADIDLNKKMLNNRLVMRLYFTDIFNSLYEKEESYLSHSHIGFYRKRPTRTAGISLNWNFSSGKKFTGKKIEQGNAEEKGRIGS